MLKACCSLHKFNIHQTVARPHPTIAMAVRQCSSNSGNNKRPKAVIFDMGGVILPSPLGVFREFENSKSLAPGLISRFIVGRGSDSAWAKLECGQLSPSEFSREFSKELSRETGHKVDAGPILQGFGQGQVEIFPVMREAIECIREEGIKTALLTNNWFVDEAKTKTLIPLDTSLFDVLLKWTEV